MKSILAAVVTLVIGIVIGRFLLSRDAWVQVLMPFAVERQPATPVEPEPLAAELAAAPRDREPSARESLDARAPALVDAPDERPRDRVISEALRAYASKWIAIGWRDARNEEISDEDLATGLAQFEETVLALPHSLGAQLAEQRTRSEMLAADALRGGAFTLLEKLDAGEGAPVLSLVYDTAAFDALFVREAPELGVDLALAKKSSREELTDGSTFAFPAGCFLIDNLLERGANSAAPKDFTITGAGMDAKLLVLDQDLGSRGAIRNFTLRDCTVHTDSNYLFDHRQGGASVTLERVRVVGFDMGAGSSCAFALNDGVVLSVRSCRFEGGFGRSPGSGTLFDMRTDAFVARFDDTLVQHVNLGFEHIRPNATVLFVYCRLENVFSWGDPIKAVDDHAGLEFVATTVTLHEKVQGQSLKRDLDELFPGWQQRLER
jgi:hypothetical protein